MFCIIIKKHLLRGTDRSRLMKFWYLLGEHIRLEQVCVLLSYWVTVKAAPQECVNRTGLHCISDIGNTVTCNFE